MLESERMLDDDTLRALMATHGVGQTLTRGILIVDDERPNLVVLGTVLDADYQIHEATSGAAALELAKTVDLDLVITDQRMPEMTGVELLEKLRAIKPDLAGIVVTGYTDPPAIISAINKANVFRFVKKPWQAEEILEVVRQASEHVAQKRAIARLLELLSKRTADLEISLAQTRDAQQKLLHMERLSTMGQLSAGVIHDLRNVMVGMGYIETVLKEEKVAADVVESVSVGMRGVRNLIQTLETMHQYARSGVLQLNGAALVPSATVVSDAVAISRMDLNYRMHKVEVRVADDLPPVLGDRQKLTQVLVNLVRNALQATERWRHVVIEAKQEDGRVVFAVEDDGPGLSREVRESLFQPFVSGKAEGMGMGLYMAKLIIDLHKGEIVAVDRPQGGARFEVRLPAAETRP
jgi:signal transduction histidine kinase